MTGAQQDIKLMMVLAKGGQDNEQDSCLLTQKNNNSLSSFDCSDHSISFNWAYERKIYINTRGSHPAVSSNEGRLALCLATKKTHLNIAHKIAFQTICSPRRHPVGSPASVNALTLLYFSATFLTQSNNTLHPPVTWCSQSACLVRFTLCTFSVCMTLM